MYKAINLEIIYLYIVINNYLNKPSKNNQRKLYDFFEGNTLFDKKVFYIAKNILENSYKLETLYDLTKKDIIHLKKFKEVLDFYSIIVYTTVPTRRELLCNILSKFVVPENTT